MSRSVILSLIATLTVGGALGSVVTHQVMARAEVTCPAPPAPPPDRRSGFYKIHPPACHRQAILMRKLGLLSLALILLPVAAHAQVATTDGVDQILTRFNTVSAAWVGPIQNIALGTFGILAVIDLVYFVGIRQALSGNFEVGNFMQALVHEVLYLGFFFWLLTAFATTGPLIIKGFQLAAGAAGGLPITPNAIFNAGTNIADKIADQASIWHPGDAVAMLLCGLIVQGCFLWIVISMIYVIIESYFVTTAGQIILMFGGIRFGSDIAVSLVRTCISIGLKLFALQLIASVGTAFIQDWVAQSAANTVTFQGILIEIGETVVLAAITTSVPNMFERMVGGAGTGSAGSIVGTAATLAAAGTMIGRAAVKAITTAAGGAAATAAAGSLASAQLATRTAAGTGPATAAGRVATLIGSTARNLASAKVEDIGRGLRGSRSNLGQSAWRMATNMSEQARVANEAKNKPQPPSP